MSRSQVGSGSVRPAVPLVTDTQFTAITWTRNKKATVMMTNDGPRERSETRPRTSATRAATTPPSGTHHQALTDSKRAAIAPMV